MTHKNLGIGLAVLLVASGALAGQEKKDSQESNLLSPEDFLQLRGIQDPQFSPDGTRLAFVATDPLSGQHRTRHIWVYDLKSKAARQFTYSEKSETSPRWSPDGKQLAFLSSRGGDQQQIFAMRVDGGEASALTKGKESVGAFEWAPDGQEIAFLAADAKSDLQEKKEKENDDSHVADKDERHARLRILDIATNK